MVSSRFPSEVRTQSIFTAFIALLLIRSKPWLACIGITHQPHIVRIFTIYGHLKHHVYRLFKREARKQRAFNTVYEPLPMIKVAWTDFRLMLHWSAMGSMESYVHYPVSVPLLIRTVYHRIIIHTALYTTWAPAIYKRHRRPSTLPPFSPTGLEWLTKILFLTMLRVNVQ